MSLLNFFIETEKKEETPVAPKPIAQVPVYVPPTSIGEKVSSSHEAVNQHAAEFQAILQKVYEAGNFPGPDYQELMNGVNQLNGVIPDEKAKFIAGYTMLKQSGQLDKNKLLTTANKYIDLLVQEQTKFKAEIQRLINAEIGAKNKKLESFKSENDNIEKQLQALMAKKAENDNAYNALAAEINDDKHTLSIKEQGFDIAVNAAVGEIKENINKIQSYIS